MSEKGLDHIIDDLAALENRTGALEVRLSTAESRQLRTEKQLAELVMESRHIIKSVQALTVDVEELQHIVNDVLVARADQTLALLRETQKMIQAQRTDHHDA